LRTEDRHLIYECLNGSPVAFGLLVDKYKESIYALAYSKLGNFHDAEDISQEVFIRAYQRLRALRSWDSFHAWLYAITSNLCKNWIRKQSRQIDEIYADDQDESTLDSPSMESYRRLKSDESLDETLYEALSSLPEIYRQTLSLYYLGGMNSRDIARFLGTSYNVIEQRLKRGREKLREEILIMMTTAFEQQRLHGGFTFHIIEIVKRLKIQHIPRLPWIQWGVPTVAGLLIGILAFTLNPKPSSLFSIGLISPDRSYEDSLMSNVIAGDERFAPNINIGETSAYAAIPATLVAELSDEVKKPDSPQAELQAEQKNQEEQASFGTSDEGPVMLQFKPYIGEKQISKLKTETRTVLPTGEVIISKVEGDLSIICLGVDDDGTMTTVSMGSISIPTQTFENVAPEMQKQYEEAMKQSGLQEYYSAINKIFSIIRRRSDGYTSSMSVFMPTFANSAGVGQNFSDLMKAIQIPLFPNKPVNIGDNWTGETKGLSFEGKLLGFENIKDQKCAKIQFDLIYKTEMGEAKGTIINFLAVDDGISLKGETRNEYAISSVDVNSISTTELQSRNNIPPDQLKQMQTDITKLDEILKVLSENKYDESKVMLNEFLESHPNSPFFENAKGLIAQIDAVKKIQESMMQRN